MKKICYTIFLLCAALSAQAAIITDLTQAPGFGSDVDVTSGSFIAWGYATGALNDGFDNFQSGTSTPGISSTTATSTRDYGYTFTFNDGNSPTTGTTVSTSGGQAGLLSDGPTLTFSGIVSTETRILTLYVGGYQGGNDSVDMAFDATLTGGTSDEFGTTRTFVVNNTTTDTDPGYAVATYTIQFSSATETDLVINTSYSNLTGTRNIGISGYTVQAIPEPSSLMLALTAMGALFVLRNRSRM